MLHHYVFADEAGCFTFKIKPGASRYFILCTLATADCSISNDLLQLRRELWEAGECDRDKLHATTDAQSTRDKVFEILAGQNNVRIDATIFEKSKAQPQTRTSEPQFYQYAWFYHFKHVFPRLTVQDRKVLIHAAALGSKKTRAAFKLAVNNSVQQIAPRDRWEAMFIDSAKDPMLWAVDYCAWAIQRKWELNDSRSFDIIKRNVASEYDLWKIGTTHYYT